MRTGAQVGKFALLIERDDLVLRQVIDELNLIRLILHQLQCFRPGQLKTLHLELFLADFAHFCLDLLHDLRGERKWRIQVIIEAVVNRRTDCQLYLRVQALDSLCQNMGAGMPVCFAILLIFKRILIVCHEKFLLIFTGQKKNPTPDQNQGWDDNASHGSTLLGTAKNCTRSFSAVTCELRRRILGFSPAKLRDRCTELPLPWMLPAIASTLCRPADCSLSIPINAVCL